MGKFEETIAVAVREEVSESLLRLNYLTGGKIFWVFNSADVAYTDGSFVREFGNKGRIFTSVENANAAVTTNRNDIVFLNGQNIHNVDALLDVTKSRIHYIGLDSGDRMIQHGARIGLSDVTADIIATIRVSGTRNTFRNLKIENTGTHANSVAAVIGNGDEGTLWKNCSFQKQSDLGETTVSDFENRSDSANFINCEFGFSTLLITAARRSLWFKASGATRSKDNRFYRCRFVCQSSSSAYVFVEVNTTASLAFTTLFEDCTFYASLVASGAAIVDAIQSILGLVEGELAFVNPHSFNCTNLCATVKNQVFISGPISSAQGGEAIAAG